MSDEARTATASACHVEQQARQPPFATTPTSTHAVRSAMGCCGESTTKPNDQYDNRPPQPSPYYPGVVTQQPGAHPGPYAFEKSPPPLLDTTIPTHPPPVHYGGHAFAQSGHAPPPPSGAAPPVNGSWNPHGPASPRPTSAHSTSRSMRTASAMSAGPMTLSNPYNPASGHFGGPTTYPSSTVLGRSIPTSAPAPHLHGTMPSHSMAAGALPTRPDHGGPSAEGKMSISIDFGVCRVVRVCVRTLMPHSLCRYDILWCGGSPESGPLPLVSADAPSVVPCMSFINTGIRLVPHSVRKHSANSALARFHGDVSQSADVPAL